MESPMLSKKLAYHVAIVGATGTVGAQMIEVFEERKFPVGTLRPLASSRSVGGTVSFQGADLPVQLLTHDSFAGIDLVLLSAGSDVGKELAPGAAKAGAIVIDNNAACRMDLGDTLVVPDDNPVVLAMLDGTHATPHGI